MSKGVFGDWDPFDGLFDDFLKPKKLPTPAPAKDAKSGDSLSYRSLQASDAMTMEVDVPGATPSSLKVSVTKFRLIVEGERDGKAFVQRFTIDHRYDLSYMFASYKHGRMYFKIPARQDHAPVAVHLEFK